MNVRKIRVKTEAPVLMKSETINATAEMGIWVWTAKPPSTTANKFNVRMAVFATAYPKQPRLNVYAPLGLREPVATKLLKKIVKTTSVCLILAKMAVLASKTLTDIPAIAPQASKALIAGLTMMALMTIPVFPILATVTVFVRKMPLPQVAIFVKIWLVPVPVARLQRFAVKPRKMEFLNVNVPIIKFPDLLMKIVLDAVLNSMVLTVKSVLRGTGLQVNLFKNPLFQ
jgi:hypothetical protein